MRRQRSLTLSLFVLLAALAPAAAEAQVTTNLRGTWNLNRQASDNLDVAINRAVARMNIVVRQIARPRLRSTNTMYPTLVVSQEAANVRVNMAGRPTLSTPYNGQPVLWQRQTGAVCREIKGDCVRVTSTIENGHLRQVFQAEDGRRTNLYTVSADGSRMTMDVTIESPKLPNPLNYKLVYNRAN